MNIKDIFQPTFKIGADPELFVFRNGEPISAHNLIPGTKADPFPVPGGAVQVDGTAAEFNINPATTFDEFNYNIESVLENLRALLPDDCELRAVPVVVWPEEYFSTLPFVATELGCMPDFDAWTGRRNPKPRLKSNPTLRTAAGHIHIGFTEGASLQDTKHIMAARQMAQLMDLHVGAWSVEVDTDKTRRQLYGKAGACRYKTYGVEYRTLSNFWVLSTNLRRDVWDRTMVACEAFFEGNVDNLDEEVLKTLINCED
jgi:hypothetical protein